MSIPLIQKPEKDDINTSIIAIKRNIERINMLLGLVDNDSPDLSGFATKQELQDAVTELQPIDEVTVGNMHSVTSNAVASALSYSTVEHKTGEKWINGKDVWECVFVCTTSSLIPENSWIDFTTLFAGLGQKAIEAIVSVSLNSHPNYTTNEIGRYLVNEPTVNSGHFSALITADHFFDVGVVQGLSFLKLKYTKQ